MKNLLPFSAVIALFSLLLFASLNCTGKEENDQLSKEEMIARGKYIVTTGGCEDCHSPKVYTEMGPMFDTTRTLSGYPQDEPLPVIDPAMVQPGMWIMTDKHLAGWVGPWGISFAANLTPDNATGIGALSEEMFIKTLREGKWMGVGRPLLPPMPWQTIGMMTDQDLKSVYAYLMSLPPIKNEVPQPVTPDKLGEYAEMK
jgi:mono/diheme cytochrome c family protein